MDSPQLARIFIDNAFLADLVSSVCVSGKLTVLAQHLQTVVSSAAFLNDLI